MGEIASGYNTIVLRYAEYRNFVTKEDRVGGYVVLSS